MYDFLLAGLPAELFSAMRKSKLTNPGTLRSYTRSALGVSAGVLAVPESTSSTPTDPGTLLIPTSAPDPNTRVVEPEDPDGLPRIAEEQGGSGRHDGLTGMDDANEETSDEGQRSLEWSLREKSALDREGVDGSSVISKSTLSIEEGGPSAQSESLRQANISPSADKDRVHAQSEESTRYDISSAASSHTRKRDFRQKSL